LWLILCHGDDPCGPWAREGLLDRGLAPVRLLRAESLGPALRWEHRIGREGASVAFTLPGGEEVRSDRVRGVLNRLGRVTGWHSLSRATAADREYAIQEIYAFFLSWLSCLPGPVLNRPTPQGLCGRERHESEWVWLARAADLPVSPYRLPGDDALGGAGSRTPLREGASVSVLVVGRRVFGPVTLEVGDSCRRLAELADTAILGIDLVTGADGRWWFACATPRPDLRVGGEPVLDLLAEIFRAEGVSR
jgi:hypothetical protein